RKLPFVHEQLRERRSPVPKSFDARSRAHAMKARYRRSDKSPESLEVAQQLPKKFLCQIGLWLLDRMQRVVPANLAQASRSPHDAKKLRLLSRSSHRATSMRRATHPHSLLGAILLFALFQSPPGRDFPTHGSRCARRRDACTPPVCGVPPVVHYPEMHTAAR